jgi:hypothetical protein
MNRAVCIDIIGAGRFLPVAEARGSEAEHSHLADPERVLSRPPKPVRRRRRMPKWVGSFSDVSEVLWLAVIVVCGIAAIIGLRDIGAMYGVIWAGDR